MSGAGVRALVVGAGSIGRRHLANLRALGVEERAVVDADPARAEAASSELGAVLHRSMDEALAAGPELAVIATPTHLHVEPALACARAGAHLLVEKPLADRLDGRVAALREEVARRGRFAMVGCNLRFDDVYAGIGRHLAAGDLGRVFAARLHFGYDLRRWRPGVDYRRVYSAHRAEGGGVLLDAIHELDLARWWFGDARRVLALPRRTGALEGDVEDVADLVIEFRSGVVAEIHLDYRDPVYRRVASVSGDRALVEGDFAARTLRLRRADGEPGAGGGAEGDDTVRFADDRNAMYLRELAHVVDVVRGRARPVSVLDDGVAALELALAARDRGPVVELTRRRAYDRVPIVLQARLGSTRLPGKVLKPALGRPLLELLVERLRRAKRVDRIVLATSEAPSDRALVAEAERLGLPWFVGSESDVLDRYLGAVRRYDLPAVVRITSDCPLLDPAIVDATVEKFLASGADYCSNAFPRSVPDGMDVEVVSREALERAGRDCTRSEEREHVTQFIVRHPERFEHASLDRPDAARLAPIRITLDTAADYELLRAVYEELYPTDPAFTMEDVVRALAERPRLRALYAALPPH